MSDNTATKKRFTVIEEAAGYKRIRCQAQCKGVNAEGGPALETAILVNINIARKEPPLVENLMITSVPVQCPHNTGSNKDRCKASHPEQNKIGEGIACPFSFDYPYVTEASQDWQPPEEIKDAMYSLLKGGNP